MTSTTTSRIVWPRPGMAGCVFCTIIRDTRGVTLDAAQRFNFFPAAPLCSIAWVLAGDCHLIDHPDQMEDPAMGKKVPALSVFGPQLGPLVSWNPGETYGVSISFYPDAFSAMTGLDLSRFTGRMVEAEAVLPERMLMSCRSFADAVRRDDVENSLPALEAELQDIWAGARPAGIGAIRSIEDWSRYLLHRAAMTDLGRSTRQIARRIKSWTGVSRRDIQGLGHTEQLYAKLHEALEKDDVDWAQLAATTGFADQAHMIRQMRRHTGLTPEQLRRRAREHEAFWAYRLLEQYFTMPDAR
ncbi:helix-turn-helix domain-containing protein [Chelatococcus asaccharovorans]|uniref:AraC family transcriptional regulator n=1 Tax=Chelatococcus asaccharovorans TaxID=28210 RepID=A0A2V3U8Q1_9HYPH|nr:AraC family transcriptional regulator [Chelatococcus asaccharovorans]MBS7706056.1 helix-turn-helix transcriptional regulator [Chelatococcus asaccharovorans]PXW59080.1 AraC family transcriptional regulator [Chelatococcus asaccharovorans]CAH1659764.1 AraC family transcriptional regulator [Chelatococcus asaccharovorans]CAH1684071.1 AraC family transcriptional regulator [Chelatococcus asaccharovorans]